MNIRAEWGTWDCDILILVCLVGFGHTPQCHLSILAVYSKI